MKILYTTDLHGSDMFYAITRKRALENNVDMIINGGDMLPKRGHNIFEAQEKFIRTLEKRHFKMIEKHRIPYLCCLGNDDMRIYDQAFDEVCSKFEFVHNIAGRKVEIGGFEFIGFNLITDYQFQMKDRCRMDTRDFKFAKQNGVGNFTTENGWEEIGTTIEDWFELARSLPTIEEELNALPNPKDPRKTIYVTHMPPAGVGLDGSQDRPVSKAVFEFIKNSNALLSLHGHIHDSFKVTRIWNAQVGNTRAIQPGQYGSIPVYCIIDITPSGSQEIKIEMKRFAHPGDQSFDKNPGVVVVPASGN